MTEKSEQLSPAPLGQRERPSNEEALLLVPNLIRQLYAIVDEFEFLFAPRRFTPDGHLLGSIGEVVAAYAYDLDLLCSGSECHDAEAKDGRMVQIKLTGGTDSVGLYGDPEHLIVLQLQGRKRFVEVYNGPGAPAWEQAGKMQKHGQRPISLSRLRRLNQLVTDNCRLRQCKPFPDLRLPELESGKVDDGGTSMTEGPTGPAWGNR